MDKNTLDLLFGLFVVILPCSAYSFSLGLVAAGVLRDEVDQRRIFPVQLLNKFFHFSANTAGPLPKGPNSPLFPAAAIGVGFCNFAPAFVLVANPYGGSATRIAVVGYLLVHGLWLAMVARAIRRSGGRQPTS